MNRPISEIKRIARGNLTGQYTVPIIASLLVSLIPSLVMLPFSMLLPDTTSLFQNIIYYVAYFIILILSVVLETGLLLLHLNLARKRPYSLKDLIYCFRTRPDAFILAFLLYVVYLLPFLVPAVIVLALGLTFFGIPGTILGIAAYVVFLICAVIFALYYALIFFLLLENPNQKLRSVFAESKRIMTGNRKAYFLLTLSFLPLYILGILSLGIGLLWVNPYLIQSQTVFYLDLRGELNTEGIPPEDTSQSSFAQP